MTDLGWRSAVPADRLAGYFPGWLNNLADDVTIEGSMMDGVIRVPTTPEPC